MLFFFPKKNLCLNTESQVDHNLNDIKMILQTLQKKDMNCFINFKVDSNTGRLPQIQETFLQGYVSEKLEKSYIKHIFRAKVINREGQIVLIDQNSQKLINPQINISEMTGEMAKWSRALSAITEDTGATLRTHMVEFQGIPCTPLASLSTRHACSTPTYMRAKHSYK